MKRVEIQRFIQLLKIRRYFRQKIWLLKILEAFNAICQDNSK